MDARSQNGTIGTSARAETAEVLSGGKPYDLEIDPATGEAKRVPKELDTKHLLLGALSNILGSVGHVSSNLSARMQGRAPAPIQPLPTQQAQQARGSYDYIVVGGGAAGSVVAGELSRAGMDALLIESGGRVFLGADLLRCHKLMRNCKQRQFQPR